MKRTPPSDSTSAGRRARIARSIVAALAAIEHAGKSGDNALVNFTGGTKLMSIGAYVAALKHKTPSFYVDTQDSLFVDGQSADGLADFFAGDLSFTPLLRSLSLNAVAAANGCGRITNGHDWQPWLPLANHLLQNPADEETCHRAIQSLALPPRRATEWLAALDRDLPLPETAAAVAIQSGHYRPGTTPGTLRLPDTSRSDLTDLAALDGQGTVPGFHARLFKTIAPLQLALNFLGGAWWEVIIAERLRQTGRFRDIRWSAQIGERGGPDLEEDVVALDGVRVAYFSCKRSSQGAKLLSQLEQIKARAERLGGAFNHRFLCVYQKPRGATLRNLEQRARELGIRLIFADDLQKPDPFA